MWIVKFKFTHPNSLSISYAQKFNVTKLIFPLTTVIRNGIATMTAGHIILADEKTIDKYFAAISKEKRVMNIEREGNFVAYSISVPEKESHLQMYFKPDIFLVKPVTIKPDGFQYIELASWKKENLTKMLKEIAKFGTIHSQSISKESLTDIYIPHLMPSMTISQKKAILLAFRNGYYEYPRKITIERLADLAKLAPSSLQEHLRKAENKLLPYLLENISGK
ncbi:MAG: helix-turn-helix domain-containing protein [Candidatus Diapherotrites archaeon]|nr:helix-turn-helix domain-containing protein [Candidatus Diapherotrites archaeon]